MNLRDNMDFKKLVIDYIDLNLEQVSKTFAGFFKAEHGLSHNQMSVIWYLRKFGMMTMGECADKMLMSKQQFTQLVNTLVAKGMVKRLYTEENRRIINIILGEKGQEVILDVENRYVQSFLTQLERFTDAEQQDFLMATNIIIRLLPRLQLGPPERSIT